MKYSHLLFALFLIGLKLYSQNTVGTLTNESSSYNGYTLFTANHSTETYLINNCGKVINQWTSSYPPGVSVYLLQNGRLLRTAKINNANVSFGGVGGKIELFDWDNTLLWEFTYSSTQVSQHHDVFPLPNGNILMLAVSTMTEAEAIQAGRDPIKIEEGKLFNEQIIELEPDLVNGGTNIVWEWNIKDHLIQEFDNTKDNYGIIADNPQLLDINYLNGNSGAANWLHVNSIQYNVSLDQIILSSRLLSEIYIIDHSTNSSEAASHTGGIWGKGGDFLYRWGNPEAYGHGNNTDRTLWGQHYPHWIEDGLTDAGKIMIYNNGVARGVNGEDYYSSLDIIDPLEISPGVYTYDVTTGYGPSASEWSYTKPIKEEFYSPILSSGQRLPNGNTLICIGFFGHFFEIDSSNNIVWEYINPDTTEGIQTQGVLPTALGAVFRAIRYPTNYAAFNSRDLNPGKTIEIGNDLGNCSILNSKTNKITDLKIFPNPTKNVLNIKSIEPIDKIEIRTILGELVLCAYDSRFVNLSHLSKGLYILKIYLKNSIISRKVIKQ